MGNIPLHARAVPRLDVGAQTSNSSISDPSHSYYLKSGSSVGPKTNAEKKMVRTARDAAIRDGFVEAGRLNDLAREVVPVRTAYGADLTDEQKQQLGTVGALYLRITDKGRFRLHPDWTPSA